MTGGATIAASRELQIAVAASARHTLVLPDENETCLAVVKRRVGPHAPRIGGMARLTRQFEIAVG